MNLGQSSAKFPGIGNVSIVIKEYPKIENEDILYEYLADTGQDDIIKRTIHPQTLKGWWGDLENKDSINVTDIGISVYKKTTLQLRKVK